jgi:hypothetical protein
MPIHEFIKEMRAAFADYSEARMPIEQRQAWAKRMGEIVARTRPSFTENVEQYVHACYEISTSLTSDNLGNARFEICQKIIAGCLPYIDAVPVELAMDVVGQMSYSLDLDAKPLTDQSFPAYRNAFVEHRLRVWKRILAGIDPTWDANDPKNAVYLNMSPPGYNGPGGIAPEAIKEPNIRQEYERMLAENAKRACKNSEQLTATRNRERWLGYLQKDMASMYGRAPVSEQDWEMLKAYLRIYVADAKLRQELYDRCRKAAVREPASQPTF